jgi:pimeloyl-ACP methyl ester carboxylesterase
VPERVKAPTLVIHSRHDADVPFEQGQEFAAAIPRARFTVLDIHQSRFPRDLPAWQRYVRLIQDFLAESPRGGAPRTPDLHID